MHNVSIGRECSEHESRWLSNFSSDAFRVPDIVGIGWVLRFGGEVKGDPRDYKDVKYMHSLN